jgi:nitrogen fixation NifU-like protein
MSGFDDKLLKHFLNPKNVGTIEDTDGYARVENPVNGYTTDIYIKIENGKISNAKFKSMGCTSTIATASAITELVKDVNVDDLINKNDNYLYLMNLVNNELGKVPDKNWHCLPTAVMGVITALLDYYNKQNDVNKIKKLENIIYKIKKYIEEKLNE